MATAIGASQHSPYNWIKACSAQRPSSSTYQHFQMAVKTESLPLLNLAETFAQMTMLATVNDSESVRVVDTVLPHAQSVLSQTRITCGKCEVAATRHLQANAQAYRS